MPSFSLQIFGEPTAFGASGLCKLAANKPTTLLLLLALRDGEGWASRDWLCEELGILEGGTRDTLRPILTRARQLPLWAQVAPPLESRVNGDLRWRPATDVNHFHQACERGDWLEAIRLHKRPLLEAYAAKYIEQSEALTERRAQLLVQRDLAVTCALEHLMATRNFALALEVVTLLEKQDADLMDDHVVALVMQAAALAGRSDLAEYFLERHRRALEREGFALSDELRRLMTRIAEGELPESLQETSGPNPGNLDPHRFEEPLVGRAGELEQMFGLVQDVSSRILTLTGPGGVGKTHLAWQFALENRALFPDGVYLVNLADAGHPEHVLRALLDGLGLPPLGQGALEDQLVNALRHRRALIVLDNYEASAQIKALCVRIAREAQRCKLLVTSRERLSARGDEAAALEQRLEVGRLDLEGAWLLFQHAGGSQAVPETPVRADFARVHTAVGGLPLALKLIAGQTSTHSLSNLADRLEADRDPAWDAPLRRAFEVSARSLPPTLLERLTSLAVFPMGFGADAAREVTGASVTELSQLQARSLLQIDRAGRYEWHPMVRRFALRELEQNPDAHARLRSVHARLFAHWLETRFGSAQHRSWAYPELANLRLAWEGLAQDATTSASSLVQYGEFAIELEEIDAAERLFRAALDRQGGASAWLGLGIVLKRKGSQEAIGAYQNALERARRDGDEALEARVLNRLALALQDDQPQVAQQHLERSRALFERTGETKGEAMALRTLGRYRAQFDNDLDAAQSLLFESAAKLEALHEQAELALTFNNLAVVLRRKHLYEDARVFLERVIAIYQDLDEHQHAHGVALAQGNLANLMRDMGQIERALELYAQVIPAFERLSDPDRQASMHNSRAALLMEQGDPEGARLDLLRSVELVSVLGLTWAQRQLETLVHVAEWLEATGETAHAGTLARWVLSQEHVEPPTRHHAEAIARRCTGDAESVWSSMRDVLHHALSLLETRRARPSNATTRGY
jgi:tetratricopeptide (TPR) repeat protein